MTPNPDDLPLTPRASVLRGRNVEPFVPTPPPRSHSPGGADDRPQQVCERGGRGPRGLRPGRCGGRQARRLAAGDGSEVALCLEAYEQLKAEGIKARVVSMPSWELFDDQPQDYRDGGCRPQ